MSSIRSIIIAALAVTSLAGAQTTPATPRTYSLKECLDLAFKQSPDLARAKSALAVSSAGLTAAVGDMLPSVTASSRYNRSGSTASDVPLVPVGDSLPTHESVTDQYGTTLSVSQNLINLPVLAGIGQSIYSRKAAGASYDQARAALSYDVHQAYYGLVKLQKALQVALSSVDQSEQQAKRARLMAQLGSISRSDLLKIEVQLTQSKVDLLNARTALRAGQQTLATLIGLQAEVAADTALAMPDTSRTPIPLDSLRSAALEASPAYRAARNAYRSAAVGAWSSWTAKLPALTGSYSYGYANGRQYQDWDEWRWHDSWTVGLALTWNVFDGFGTEAAIRRAYAAKRTAEADLFTARQSVASQVDQAHQTMTAARERIALVGTLQQQAEEDYRLTSEKYRLGSASVLDLLTSQVTYNQAQLTATNAICDYHLAEARLRQALGQW